MANPNRGEILQKSLVKRGKLLYNTSQKDADMDQEKDQYEIPEVLPMLPARDIIIFPYMILPLFVSREKSINAIEEALSRDRLIFLVAHRDMAEEDPTPERIYHVGTIAIIMRMLKLANGRLEILVQNPSAGVTMAISIISALTNIAVKKDVAMTGEITLRRRILPVGGVKEKTLAALTGKVCTLIIPHQNRKDLDEIPPYARKKMNFVLAKHMDDISAISLDEKKWWRDRRTRGVKKQETRGT